MLFVTLTSAIRSERENDRHSDIVERLVAMKRILELLVFATILTMCSADCRPGLNGRQDWYQCEHLTDLRLEIPAGAVGIEIRNSSIRMIPADAFIATWYINTLEELNITGCGVEEIEPNAFRGLGRLRVLGLVDNRIRVLDALWLQDLTSLKALIVWRNRIAEIDAQLYDLLPDLEYWDIAYNELNACLPPEMLRKLTKLRRIYIAGNPWSYRCRPSMTWYLGSNHIYFVQDWANDRLIEDCLMHEPYTDIDDVALHGCVDRKLSTVDAHTLADLSVHISELERKVNELQVDVDALKKSVH